MPQPLVMPFSEGARAGTPQAAAAWTVMFWVGLGLAIVGLADVVFLWIPPELDNLAWRLNASRVTIDALPLGTIGLAAALCASIGRTGTRGLAVVAITAGTVLLLLAAVTFLYVGGSLGLRAEGAAVAVTPTDLEILRTGLFGVVYLALYALLAGTAIRQLVQLSS